MPLSTKTLRDELSKRRLVVRTRHFRFKNNRRRKEERESDSTRTLCPYEPELKENPLCYPKQGRDKEFVVRDLTQVKESYFKKFWSSVPKPLGFLLVIDLFSRVTYLLKVLKSPSSTIASVYLNLYFQLHLSCANPPRLDFWTA